MHKVFQRIVTIMLVIIMLPIFNIYAVTDSMEHFEKNVPYIVGQFPDVDENQWYGARDQQSVMLACELGLMKGTEDGFDPNGNVTLAQAITMAARVFAIYNGGNGQFVQGQPWYQVYVDYCIENGIIQFNDFFDYNQPATRSQMAYIFANALPEFEFEKINNVEALPDVVEKSIYGKEVFLLYNAGIVGGSDELGTFSPNAYISRASAAAIISREALLEKRLTDLHFVSTSGSQALQPIEEDDTTAVDYLWNYYYSSGMKVDSKSQLEWIIYYAAANRIPDFVVKIAPHVFSDLGTYIPDGLEMLEWAYYSGTYYDTTITLQYNIYGEVKALMQSDMAWKYASREAKDRYYYLYNLLTQIETFGKNNSDKATLIHDYIVKNYKYDTLYTKYSFSDLIDSGSGVCQAYAQMFYLLANMSGIETQYLGGMAKNKTGDMESHAWNRVAIYGYWYYVDTTWDDPIPDRGFLSTVKTDYLLINKTQIDKDHILLEIDGKAVEK